MNYFSECRLVAMALALGASMTGGSSPLIPTNFL